MQLWALQGEVQLTARRYQEKFTQYMAHVRNFARDLGGGHGRVSAEGSGTWGMMGWKGRWFFLALQDSFAR